MKILSAHQPAYLPWLGYFDKIARSDIFIYLDTVQYEKNSFINRNRIKTPQGSLWLTIPVKTKGHTHSSLLTTEIDDKQPWRVKHIKSIEANYRKAIGFDNKFAELELLINTSATNLADYCFDHLIFWCTQLRISTKIVRSSTLPPMGAKSDLIFDLCTHFGAKHYLSGALGRDYLNVDRFKNAGIEIEYQNFKNHTYTQLWGDFVPNLSIVDWYMTSGDHELIKF